MLAGPDVTSDRSAKALATSLEEMGIETTYLGHTQSARWIAEAVADEQVDAVELCLAGGAGVLLLRELLRELINVGRRDVSIVVHKVESTPTEDAL